MNTRATNTIEAGALRRGRFYITAALAALFLIGTACGPARDATTIGQLESARDQVHGLYDTFTATSIDEDRVKSVQSTLEALRAYELNKGTTNTLMVKQVEAIQSLFEKHLAERRAVRSWSGTHKNNKKELIGLAFQAAIATENEKVE